MLIYSHKIQSKRVYGSVETTTKSSEMNEIHRLVLEYVYNWGNERYLIDQLWKVEKNISKMRKNLAP
jgi:heterodisulfide reductase subunit C